MWASWRPEGVDPFRYCAYVQYRVSAPYVPLWCKTSFSFLEGASQPDELVEAAQRLGLSALALCDRDGVSSTNPHARRNRVVVRCSAAA